MTRSISVWRPTTGSSCPSGPASSAAAELVEELELFVFTPEATLPAPVWRRPGPESIRMISLQIFSTSASKSSRMRRSDALVLTHEAEEDVLRPDVVVAERERLAQRKLENFRRAG